MTDLLFYKGKRVFITGHTGFKGSWLCRILINAGADVTGYSLEPPTNPNLFQMADIESKMISVVGDVRDFDFMQTKYNQTRPDIVFHLAAQPIVRESYRNPRLTYETNVMGTVNLLECVRLNPCAKSVLNVTTDKVYKNNEWCWGYRENDPLDGYDPYSNSKSCSELATHSYIQSFFSDNEVAVSTARAGNVIGGGDFAQDRIIPDCIRAAVAGSTIKVRNPYSVRPYQHVLEPLFAYLEIAERQYNDSKYSGYYNVGPDDCNCVSTGELVSLFCKEWGDDVTWINCSQENAPHEAGCLRLDCSLIKQVYGWKPRWHIEKSIEMACRFGKVWMRNGDLPSEMDAEIREYMGG